MPRLLTRRATSLALPLLATACSLGPEYQKPAQPAPAAWESTAAGAGIWPDPRWWRSFGNTELSQLVEAALAANQDLLAAIARIRQAEAQARIAAAALSLAEDLTLDDALAIVAATGPADVAPRLWAQVRDSIN